MIKKETNGIIYFEFEHLAKTNLVHHCFSSRIGGVSKPPYTSMNLAYHMGDDLADVDQNFRLISKAARFDHKKIIMTDQIHHANIQIIGVDKPELKGVDSLVTAVPGHVLVSYYADCVPLLFLDPVKKVIANSHAGWRGTAADIAGGTLRQMSQNFNCRPIDILVGIGPSISITHFEVGHEVIQMFEHFPLEAKPYMKQKSDKKWHIDLREINQELLLQAGVLAKNIEVSDLCTYEHPDLFFSHRRDGSKRGNMAAMIALKEGK